MMETIPFNQKKYNHFVDRINKIIASPEKGKITKWDARFLDLARSVSKWSKDPNTKVGAVIADEDNRIISLGFNGFPRGVSDSLERLEDKTVKNKMVLHAEHNAISFANMYLSGASIYVYELLPCPMCTANIIQHDISHVIIAGNLHKIYEKQRTESIDFNLSLDLFNEVGITVSIIGVGEIDDYLNDVHGV